MAEKDIDGIEITDANGKTVRVVKVTGDAANLLRKAAAFGGGSEGRPIIDTNTRLRREASPPTDDQAFWVAIRNRTQAIGFNKYCDFIDNVLCPPGSPNDYGSPSVESRRNELAGRKTIHGTDAYNLLKLATEAFLISQCGVVPFEGGVFSTFDEVTGMEKETAPGFDPVLEGKRSDLPVDTQADRDNVVETIRQQLMSYLGTAAGSTTIPYLDRIVNQITGRSLTEGFFVQDVERQFAGSPIGEGLPYCKQEVILQHRATCPSMIELIWSYWHEEGLL
ncbi:MAG: hypothetical protein ACRERU_18145, partial [Methylococcales bacterium]